MHAVDLHECPKFPNFLCAIQIVSFFWFVFNENIWVERQKKSLDLSPDNTRENWFWPFRHLCWKNTHCESMRSVNKYQTEKLNQCDLNWAHWIGIFERFIDFEFIILFGRAREITQEELHSNNILKAKRTQKGSPNSQSTLAKWKGGNICSKAEITTSPIPSVQPFEVWPFIFVSLFIK